MISSGPPDRVEITGLVYTGRDAVHKYLHEGGQLPDGVNLQDGIIYHCGPVVIKDDDGRHRFKLAEDINTVILVMHGSLRPLQSANGIIAVDADDEHIAECRSLPQE